MAGISAESFLNRIKQVCANSVLVVRISTLSESRHQVRLRIFLSDRTFITVYYNDENGKTAFAQIRDNQRIFGADNTHRQWHWHPREDPADHVPAGSAITFEEFLEKVEKGLE